METAIVEILKEIAKTVRPVVLQRLGASPIEKDMNKLYENVKSYHSRTRELSKHTGIRKKKSLNRMAIKLADDIEKDGLFFMYVTTEKAEKVVDSLRHLHRLSRIIPIISSEEILKRKPSEQTQIIRYLLKIFEEIFGSIQSKQMEGHAS